MRMQLVELYKDDPSPQIYVRRSVPPDEYVAKIRQAKGVTTPTLHARAHHDALPSTGTQPRA